MWSGPTPALGTQPDVNETMDGIFTSSLILSNPSMFFSGDYQCTARYINELCTTSISSSARLDVIAPPVVLDHTSSPLILNRASNTRLSVQFEAHPNFTDVHCNGPSGDININTPRTTVSRIDDNSNFQILINIDIISIDFIHGGVYTCSANNSAGSIEASILLIVIPVVDPQQPLAKDGDNVTLTCLSQSSPEPSYLWEKRIDGGDSDVFSSILNRSVEITVVTDQSLNFAPIEYEDEGTYRCVITILYREQESMVSSEGITLSGSVV